MPLGSVMYRRGRVSFGSNPTIRVEMPNGRTPPDCVYRWKTEDLNKPRSEYRNHLLNARDMSGNVFDGDGVFDSKPVALAFYPSLVDEHSTIGRETW